MSESESDSTSTTASESNRSIPAKPCEGRGNPRTAGSRLQLRHWPCIPTQHPKSASLHWGLARPYLEPLTRTWSHFVGGPHHCTGGWRARLSAAPSFRATFFKC